MFFKKKRKKNVKEEVDRIKPINIKEKKTPLDKIPDDVLAKAITEMLKKKK